VGEPQKTHQVFWVHTWVSEPWTRWLVRAQSKSQHLPVHLRMPFLTVYSLCVLQITLCKYVSIKVNAECSVQFISSECR